MQCTGAKKMSLIDIPGLWLGPLAKVLFKWALNSFIYSTPTNSQVQKRVDMFWSWIVIYPFQICAASKNINLITVAVWHCSLFWKYKLVLRSSEIGDWKLDTSLICTKEKLSKIWDLWSDGEKEKEKKDETSAASPRKGRNKQAQSLTHVGEKEKGRRLWETILPGWESAGFLLSHSKDFHAFSGLPPRAPLSASLVS